MDSFQPGSLVFLQIHYLMPRSKKGKSTKSTFLFLRMSARGKRYLFAEYVIGKISSPKLPAVCATRVSLLQLMNPDALFNLWSGTATIITFVESGNRRSNDQAALHKLESDLQLASVSETIISINESCTKQLFAQSLCNSSCSCKRNAVMIHLPIFQKYTKLPEFQVTGIEKDLGLILRHR